jgi:transposase, IS30 family
MSKNYTQLSLVQRYQIQAFVKAGIKQKMIAQEIGVHPSTISRELNRNIASNAQRRTDQCHQFKPNLVKFTWIMKEQATQWLSNEKWSPEIISVVGRQTGKCPVSAEWLYQWIWQSKHGNKRDEKRYKKIYQHLKNGKRRRKRGARKDDRGIIHHRVPID